MTDINKEFASFEQYLKIYMKGIKVRNITRHYFSNMDDYSNFTIEQFLLLYKLSRMEELGTVNGEIANSLREILDMKMHIGSIIGEEAKKELYDPSYKNDDLQRMRQSLKTINSHLKKYHLTIDDIKFADVFDVYIKSENNEFMQEDNNIRVKRMD